MDLWYMEEEIERVDDIIMSWKNDLGDSFDSEEMRRELLIDSLRKIDNNACSSYEQDEYEQDEEDYDSSDDDYSVYSEDDDEETPLSCVSITSSIFDECFPECSEEQDSEEQESTFNNNVECICKQQPISDSKLNNNSNHGLLSEFETIEIITGSKERKRNVNNNIKSINSNKIKQEPCIQLKLQNS